MGSSKNLSSIEKMLALESMDLTANGKEFVDFTELQNLKNVLYLGGLRPSVFWS